jgi:hypothetical protein
MRGGDYASGLHSGGLQAPGGGRNDLPGLPSNKAPIGAPPNSQDTATIADQRLAGVWERFGLSGSSEYYGSRVGDQTGSYGWDDMRNPRLPLVALRGMGSDSSLTGPPNWGADEGILPAYPDLPWGNPQVENETSEGRKPSSTTDTAKTSADRGTGKKPPTPDMEFTPNQRWKLPFEEDNPAHPFADPLPPKPKPGKSKGGSKPQAPGPVKPGGSGTGQGGGGGPKTGGEVIKEIKENAKAVATALGVAYGAYVFLKNLGQTAAAAAATTTVAVSVGGAGMLQQTGGPPAPPSSSGGGAGGVGRVKPSSLRPPMPKRSTILPDPSLDPYGWGKGRWADKTQNIQWHYHKHGTALGATDPADYAEMAETWFNTPGLMNEPAKQIPGTPDWGTVYWDPNTNYFGVKTPNGEIRTFFIADDGPDQWLRETGKTYVP